MSKSRILFGILKLAALCIGGLLTLISLMAIAGLVVDNSWAQLGIALAIALTLPALVADRLLAPDAAKSDGLVGDV